jgi:hypothetical protein
VQGRAEVGSVKREKTVEGEHVRYFCQIFWDKNPLHLKRNEIESSFHSLD